MPEMTPEMSLADAWPVAYQAAVAQLQGLGPNEPPAKRPAVRASVAKAAAASFTSSGIKFARVSAGITWGRERPTVTLELITIDGQRYGGAAAIDPRLSPATISTTQAPTVSAEIATGGVRAFIASLTPPSPIDEATFLADVADDEAP